MRPDYKIHFYQQHACIRFEAMANICEVLVDKLEPALLEQVAALAYHQAMRVDHKFSRYRNDNICYEINNARGEVVNIDEEVFRLLSFADQCYQKSDGLFDISSGILRRAWPLDNQQTKVPSKQQIAALLQLVGWDKVKFDNKTIQIPAGMEIDLGAIAKEYAVGLVAHACSMLAPNASVLVNFGGDMQVSQPRKDGQAWQVSIENPHALSPQVELVEITQGALATSGEIHRSIEIDGKRYGHILNPKTGWPIEGAPVSISVYSKTCIHAGSLATIALLQGDNAENFLQQQGLQYKLIG
ncbi:ApbE-like lipoprotein [Catenovulum agarivorans DS-2]|uniref:FAD:protein FMN transferase n=1 Tax=Catenovulum agarivorans DS-2 TaxID=1328313 RepID=W7QSQ5_9ALTE|nr:FAD:protein FMN transferase [Catenovulum agarivorans]EWH10898.1 ApbE-like lipoprotein [Catenovulum agarivorans DS-2]